MSKDRTPTLTEIIEKGARKVLGSKHTCMIAKVTKWDDSKGAVDVKPLFRERFNDDTFGNFEIIQGVPFIFDRWGSFVIKARPEVGQEVMLHIHERSLDEYLTTSREDIEPRDPRRFDLMDAVATPGPSRYQDAIDTPPGTLVIGVEGTDTKIEIDEAGEVRIGAGASDGVANGNTSDTNFTNIDARLTVNETFLEAVASSLGIPYTASPVPGPSSTESSFTKSE